MKSSLSHNFDDLPTSQYTELLAQKVQRLSTLLNPFVSEEVLSNISTYTSPVSHFRMRAEFGVWHDGDDCYYTMVQKNENGVGQKVKVNHFPIASDDINQLMPHLLSAVKKHPILKHKLFQIEFLNTTAGNMLVTMIYHKKLDEEWITLAKHLEEVLSCHIIGRSRKQKIVLSQDFVIEQLKVMDKVYTYKQLEGGFTQPNAQVCQSMLTWACNQAEYITTNIINHKNKDLVELYCGNANFTLPLSQYFRKVLATEISKTSVASAMWNIQENRISNIAIARLSAEEFTEAKNGEREFRRLKQSGIEFNSYDFSTVFVDPPRAGIDDETLKLLSEFDNIIYVSCNPDTLADNLKTLIKTHTVKSTALFDQFPYTHHIEAGVLLQKR